MQRMSVQHQFLPLWVFYSARLGLRPDGKEETSAETNTQHYLQNYKKILFVFCTKETLMIPKCISCLYVLLCKFFFFFLLKLLSDEHWPVWRFLLSNTFEQLPTVAPWGQRRVSSSIPDRTPSQGIHNRQLSSACSQLGIWQKKSVKVKDSIKKCMHALQLS